MPWFGDDEDESEFDPLDHNYDDDYDYDDDKPFYDEDVEEFIKGVCDSEDEDIDTTALNGPTSVEQTESEQQIEIAKKAVNSVGLLSEIQSYIEENDIDIEDLENCHMNDDLDRVEQTVLMNVVTLVSAMGELVSELDEDESDENPFRVN